METRGSGLRIPLYTGFALVAFAANSVICRLALGGKSIDPASFSTIRLVSGATTLAVISAVSGEKNSAKTQGSWASASMLFLYAVAFSFSYMSLDAGTGALILFGAVQATMILAALVGGERPHPLAWVGIFLALAGLAWLVSPGLTAPSPAGSALMALAGIAWGGYSLRGRGTEDPLAVTANNFLRCLPLVFGLSLLALSRAHLSAEGVLLAALSGGLASGVGYVVWYAALKGLSATKAATVQLSVPVLAALGGVVFLSEDITVRLLLSAVMILGGVGLAMTNRRGPVRLRTHEIDRKPGL